MLRSVRTDPVLSYVGATRHQDQYKEEYDACAGSYGALGADHCRQGANLELTALRPAGEDAIDRGHAPAQLVGRAELIDRSAQNRTDRVADTRAHEQKELSESPAPARNLCATIRGEL